MKNFKRLLLICVFVILLCLPGCTKDGYVASKMTAGGVDIGSMSREEAINALSGLVLSDAEMVIVSVEDEPVAITASQAGAVYNIENTVDYAIENSKGFFSGWFKKEIPMQVDIDETLIEELLAGVETEVIQLSASVSEIGIEITNGISGKKFDREFVYKSIAEQFGVSEREPIVVELAVAPPDEIDYKEFLSGFGADFCEAQYIRGEDGTILVTDETVGVVFDMNNAIAIMKQHKEEGEVYIIPCTVTKPQNTKADLEAKLFRDVLSTYSTSYATSSENRCSNIALSTSSINGTVLLPGETFSFNDTVGERTVARGYKTAGAYANGQTVQQVGGGICQVSSTLYNSVLLSNLQIVERRSHQMTVGYVPLGRDATVNWGTTDFKFKNNTDYPVKLVGTINGKNVAISVVGTKTIENMKIEILTNTVSVLEPPVETVEDATKEVGYTSTKNGSKGYIVDATRVVYSNGVEVSREKLSRSSYNPTKTIVTVGTIVVEPPTETTPVVTAPVVTPAETAPVTTPVETTPVETAPVTAPVETVPEESAQVDVTPVIDTQVSDTGI